ncbi:DUF2179 domain-containing protein [Penaeicola halotolerans]|uniref:DUF2179 domain-containing protein n=1 Tax=Penaeicola halotolerans TaxID=2793196 RepID=UPI001CF8E993|nr:DUF2179 domain-containing protein [Penaeicola halotolerans]
MEQFFMEQFGISDTLFTYLVLPLIIFIARLADVSLATMRIMFVMTGKRKIAPLFGFFEALIWLLAIGQIIQNIDSPLSYLAYAGGFAGGTYIGMYIEEKLALGRVVVRVITQTAATDLIEYLNKKDIRYTNIDAEDNDGKANILFSVIKREDLREYIDTIKTFNPRAFYTVESVKKVSDEELAVESGRAFPLRFWTFTRR